MSTIATPAADLDYPQVAIDFMNHDHAEFIQLRAQLLNELGEHIDPDRVRHLLDELIDHTHRHFGDEERLMQEVGFPPYAVHKGEHDRVLADMVARVREWLASQDHVALREWLDDGVGDWFVRHVSTMDYFTAQFARPRR